jgi:hypothetical protein
MLKQIIHNKETNALYFQNNETLYKLDFELFKETQEVVYSNYVLLQMFEFSIFNLFSFDIEKSEKRFSTIKRAHSKLKEWNINGFIISCNVNFEIKEKELVLDARAKFFDLVQTVTKLSFSDVIFHYGDSVSEVKLDVEEIDSFGNSFFEKLQDRFMHFGFKLKIDRNAFCQPSLNTICNYL